MRVNQTGSNPIQNAETSGAKRTGRAAQTERGKGAHQTPAQAPLADSAGPEISSKAREFSRAKSAATDAPDVREEKVAELKRRIAADGYHIDANAVADRMVDDHLQMSGMS